MLFRSKKGLAEIATSTGINEIQQKRKADAFHKAENLKALKELAAQINGKEVSVAIKVGENGKTFGSVTTAQVAAALFELGYEIDKKKIILKDAIKTLGAFSAEIKFTEGVSAKITVSVVPA